MTGRESCSIALAERSRWFTDPRGTPNPAEPGLIVSLFGVAVSIAIKPLPTINVWWPAVGALGTFTPAGAFTTRGIPEKLVQPPGCQNQP